MTNPSLNGIFISNYCKVINSTKPQPQSAFKSIRMTYPANKTEDQWFNIHMHLWWEEQPQTQFLYIVNSEHVTKAAALVIINLVSILLKCQSLFLLPYAESKLLKTRVLISPQIYSLNCIQKWTLQSLQVPFKFTASTKSLLVSFGCTEAQICPVNDCSGNQQIQTRELVASVKVQFSWSSL